MASQLIVSLKKQSSLYGSTIKLLSPAKINLYLNILGKYPSGFHKIESIVERVSLFDEITIRVQESPRIRIFCADKALQGKHNLCYKAAQLIKERLRLKVGFDIFLKKNIPLGAGLGGGSSNAASVLLGINALLNLGLNQNKLYQLGKSLGSDINFFLSQSRYAFISGRGEKIAPFTGKTFRHIIIWPKTSLSTKEVYQNFKAKLTKALGNVKMLKYALKKGDTCLLKSNIFNALEQSALSLCQELKKAKEIFDKQGVFSSVTGSGSAFYLVLDGAAPFHIKGFVPKKLDVYEVKTW
jgi:4-diphosphocytidyl-2-C-methyl-D-erythritol kinase